MLEQSLNRKTWFEELLGFKEENPEQVRVNLILENGLIKSKVNNKIYNSGQLEIISLGDLKKSIFPFNQKNTHIRISELVGNVQELHSDFANENAVFQAASQFNLLEMVSPSVSPESGIGIYENDYTQGPASAIACGAGTVYRNYFAKVGNQIGQTKDAQIDCLEDIGKVLTKEKVELWKMQNGYALASLASLKSINKYISKLDKVEYEALKEKLKIGVQWNTEVTISTSKHPVTQVYCSALPIAYSQIDAVYWERFAKLILEATYEATFYVALKNYKKTGNADLFLTLVGGGAFGNDLEWILEAIQKSIDKFKNTPLNVKIVSYGHSNTKVKAFTKQ